MWFLRRRPARGRPALGYRRALDAAQPEPGPAAHEPCALGADELRDEAADELGGILLEAVDGGGDDAFWVGSGGGEAGERHGDVLHVGRGVGEVVGVGGVEAAREVDQAGRALQNTASEVGEFGVVGLVAVDEVAAEPVQRRGFGRGVREGRPHLALGITCGGVALFPGLGERLTSLLDVGLARVLERLGPGAGVLVRLDLRVVGVDPLVVRLNRVLRGLLALLVELDRLLGLALRPFDRVGVGIEGAGRLFTGIGSLRPLGGMDTELLPERVATLTGPAGGIDLTHTGTDLIERPVEILQVFGRRANLVRIAVDELVRLLGLTELLLARGGAEVGGDVVTPVLNRVGRAVSTDVVQAVTDLVRGPVDALTDEFLPGVDAVLDLAEARIGLVLEIIEYPHGYSPPFCCSATFARSSGKGRRPSRATGRTRHPSYRQRRAGSPG